MPRPLALHQITALAAGPVGLVEIAAKTGCDGVVIFTNLPGDLARSRAFPSIDRTGLGEMQAALRAHGVRVTNVEFFPVTPAMDWAKLEAGIVLGAELGADRIVCHIHDPEDTRAVESLGQLADLAAKHGLGVGIEFMGLTPCCASIERAAWFVDQVSRPTVGIAIDCLHLIRTGGSAADINAIPPARLSYAQICDAKGLHRSDDYLAEALDRELPGDGDLPLAAILAALPGDLPLDVEVPCNRLESLGRSTEAHSGLAVARTRDFVGNCHKS
jgi:sugar phosphate isomerase/epimerase